MRDLAWISTGNELKEETRQNREIRELFRAVWRAMNNDVVKALSEIDSGLDDDDG